MAKLIGLMVYKQPGTFYTLESVTVEVIGRCF